MCCCDTDVARDAPAAPSIRTVWPRRVATLIQWALPLTTLALVPKCPACVAAYVLFFTGIGLSFAAAAALRWTLIAFSIAAVGCLLICAARRRERVDSMA
jgi:cell division protein FtsW (lipid II flippase)